VFLISTETHPYLAGDAGWRSASLLPHSSPSSCGLVMYLMMIGAETCGMSLSGPIFADHLSLAAGRAVAVAHAHAAQPDRRDFQAASEFAFRHFLASFGLVLMPALGA
jgi:hypothetical protein